MSNREAHYSVCPHDCPSVCALEIGLNEDQQIIKVKGSAANPYTGGVICGKVARYRERIYHPDRLLYPLKRTGPKGSGQFERISWDEALNTVVQAFQEAEQKSGAESVWPYHYAGTMGLVMRNGIYRLRHLMGYSNMAGTICNGLSDAGWLAGTGGFNGPAAAEMEESDVIVIWGTNVVSTQVHVMHHLLEGQRRGAKVVVIDPYRNRTAQRADLHLPLRPGSDGALACAVMHVLFRENLADRDYLARYTDDPAGLEQHLQDKTPQWAAALTGLSAEQIEEFARLYGSSRKSYIRVGYGFSRTRNGAVNMHAVTCLPAVTGAWAVKGGGAMFTLSARARVNTSLIEAREARRPEVRTLDMSRIGDILNGDEDALIKPVPVKAMLIQNTNPMVVAPDSAAVRRGFERPDLFVCVHEQFLTETAKMADIVLPATMFPEHDDIYKPGGHTMLQVARQIVAPPGECRSNHQVISELCQRLGAVHPANECSAWELVDQSLALSGYPGADDILQQQGFETASDFAESHFTDGFLHADGRFHFRADWNALGAAGPGMPEFPDHWAITDEVSEQQPFRLVTAPAQNFLNSSFNQLPSSLKKEKQPSALIHPEVLREYGISGGEQVRIGNRRGSVVLQAIAAAGQHRDTIIVEGLWPDHAFAEGKGINHLTSSEKVWPAGGAALHDTSIWLKKAQ